MLFREIPASADAHAPSQHVPSLVSFILERHHGSARSEAIRLATLATRLADTKGPERTRDVRDLLIDIRDDLLLHMEKEERVLFPYMVSLSDALERGERPPSAPFGSLEGPLHVMAMEHARCASMLDELRRVTDDLTSPPGASSDVCELYRGIRAFEADLREHMRVENDLLFPRARALHRG
jgi:regulator of cell morphogenesis and NO signaling